MTTMEKNSQGHNGRPETEASRSRADIAAIEDRLPLGGPASTRRIDPLLPDDKSIAADC